MNKISPLILLFLLMSIASGLSAQTTHFPVRNCHTNQINQPYRQNRALPANPEFEDMVHRFKNRGALQRTQQDTLLRLPIVVHVIHFGENTGEGTNLSQAQVYSQIEVLNEDFQRKAGSSGFNEHPDGANIFLEFVPALINPQGSMLDEAGINRINARAIDPNVNAASGLSLHQIDDIIKPATIWNPDQYINIWVVKFGAAASNWLGYAIFPEAPQLEGLEQDTDHIEQTDGLVIGYQYFGSSEKGSFNLEEPFNRGRTLTHELGHYFGLIHTWGDGDCSVDDYCEDTPRSEAATYGCPSSVESCDGGEVMIENFMEYTDDACMNTFTQDQKSRIYTVLQNSPRRKELANSPALFLPLQSSFSCWQNENFINEPFQLSDLSTGSITDWQWEFSSSDTTFVIQEQHPEVRFTKAGSYSVKLTVSDQNRQDEILKTDYLTVLDYVPNNQAPVLSQEISETVIAYGKEESFRLEDWFSDAENDPLSYYAYSEDSTVAALNLQGNELNIIGLASGESTIHLIATDKKGGNTEVEIPVRVNYKPTPVFKETTVEQYIDQDSSWAFEANFYFNDFENNKLTYELYLDGQFLTASKDTLRVYPIDTGRTVYQLIAKDAYHSSDTLHLLLKAFDKPLFNTPDHIIIKTGDKLEMDLSALFSFEVDRKVNYNFRVEQEASSSVDASLFNSDFEMEALDTAEFLLTISLIDIEINYLWHTIEIPVTISDDKKEVKELLERKLRIHPNPTPDQLTITLNNQLSGKLKVRLFTPYGELLDEGEYQKSAVPFSDTYDLSSLKAGMYFLEFWIDDFRLVKRVVKI